ncbi:MAG: nucleoside triphosphate pyrophosphohydrolase [Christensenellaceae bacterium]|nr:nucleoside triphosphate pyrophosphohydrolase [Christensenellaceae bacterium]
MRSCRKLARDRIPQIMEGNGGGPISRVLSAEETLEELRRKLMEEAAKFLKSGELDGLGDIVGLCRVLAAAIGRSEGELKLRRAEKARSNGALLGRILIGRG